MRGDPIVNGLAEGVPHVMFAGRLVPRVPGQIHVGAREKAAGVVIPVPQPAGGVPEVAVKGNGARVGVF